MSKKLLGQGDTFYKGIKWSATILVSVSVASRLSTRKALQCPAFSETLAVTVTYIVFRLFKLARALRAMNNFNGFYGSISCRIFEKLFCSSNIAMFENNSKYLRNIALDFNFFEFRRHHKIYSCRMPINVICFVD